MIQLDQQALRAQFFTAFSAADPQVLWLGKNTTNTDESQPYCRLVIEPGARKLIERGVSRSYCQLGIITLTVTVPKGSGLAAGYDLRDKFCNLFTDWVSPDEALVMGESNDWIEETDVSVRLRIRFRWESYRTA